MTAFASLGMPRPATLRQHGGRIAAQNGMLPISLEADVYSVKPGGTIRRLPFSPFNEPIVATFEGATTIVNSAQLAVSTGADFVTVAKSVVMFIPVAAGWLAVPLPSNVLSGVSINGGFLNGPQLTLQQSAAPAPITEGIIQWDTDQDRIVVGDGAGQAIFGQVTPWVSYTPTFTGFGTVSGVSIWSRRVGDTLHVRGRFTGGTSTATEARVTLGFNGVDGGISSDATKVPSLQFAGTGAIGANTGAQHTVLIESNVGYLTFGLQGSSNAGLTKHLGNAFLSSGVTLSFTAEVPISGW